MVSSLLLEAGLLGSHSDANDAEYSAATGLPKFAGGNAVDRDWTPLAIPSVIEDGVELDDLTGFTVGPPLEGKQMLANASSVGGDDLVITADVV